MALVLERAAEISPSPAVLPSGKKRGPALAVIAWTGAVVFAILYAFNSGADSGAYQLEFNVVSDVRFKEDSPRTAQLIIENPSGGVDTLTDNRFASAFLDRRSTHRFNIPNGSPKRIFFAPAPPGHIVAIIGIRALAPTGRRTTQIPVENLSPGQQVELLARHPDSLLIRTLPGERVPVLELKLEPLPAFSRDRPFLLTRISPIFLLLGAVAVLLVGWLHGGRRSKPWYGEIPLTLAAKFGAAVALILAMAVVTKFNAHPDEYLHFEAANYFSAHVIPPALDDPAIEPSFSHYGVSYLQGLDSAYLIIGNLMNVIPAWLASPEIAGRLCNVLLFVLLATWLVQRLPRSFGPTVLLFSPQIWYVFSYVNSDAWALALSLAIIVQLADKQSLFGQYLRADTWRSGWWGCLLFVTLLTLLATAKRNYLLFFPFIGLVALWQTFLWSTTVSRTRLIKRWAVVVLAVALIYLPLRIGHEAINRFDSPRLRVEQAEKFAAPQFKPSEIAAGKGVQRLALQRQGVPYTDLFFEHNWVVQSFQSSCGVYQWMSLRSPAVYYIMMSVLYLALLAFLWMGICRLSWQNALFAFAILGLIIFIVLASAYQSWIADFQPQGRYLLPVVPMIVFLFYHYRESLRSRVFNLLFGCLFVCSVYSFVFVGLKHIPK